MGCGGCGGKKRAMKKVTKSVNKNFNKSVVKKPIVKKKRTTAKVKRFGRRRVKIKKPRR